MARPDYQLLHLDEGKSEHKHEYAQIYLPINAPLEVFCGHKQYQVLPHQVGFMPPEVSHQCLCEDELIVINIPSVMLKKGDLEILSRKVVLDVEDSLQPLIDLIHQDIKRNRSSMRYLYYYLYERLVENNSFRSVCYIREHFDQPVSVAELARLENYNIAYFNDWFKQQTGYTPAQYLRLYRIEKAKELLLYTNYNVLEIALQVGYNSHSAFSRAFKDSEGISPLAFREAAVGR